MSNIKINDVPQRIQYLATAGQTQFSIPFPFFQNSFIVVWQDGVQIFPGASPGQYLISGAGSPSGGLITLVTPALVNSIITIQGEMPIDRTSIYSATISNLTGSDLNGDFNREVVMLQQLNTTQQFLQLQYAPWELVSQDVTVTRDRYLPILAPQQVFRMNEAGTGFEGYTIDSSPAPSTSPYITYAVDDTLENPQNLGLLADGILKQTVTAGVATLEIAIPGTDYLSPTPPLGTMAYQDANNVNITGGSAALTSGSVQSNPILPVDLVNKAYADAIAAGFQFKSSCVVATTGALNTTYNNGASGVGATLTANTNGAISVDGVSLNVLDRLLVKDQAVPAQNGIYSVTTVGDGSNPFVITRTSDFDTSAEIQAGSIIFVQSGSTYSDTSFVETEIVVTVGTSPILFTQFSQQYPLSMGNGGTGSSITPIANGVFSTNGSSIGQLSTTLPSGLTIPGYALSGANADITSLTGLTGKLRAPTAIASSANLDVLGFTYTASAVNNFNIANAVATGAPTLLSVGTDTNIGQTFLAKGAGGFNFFSTGSTVIGVGSGAAYQHATQFTFPTTAATRAVTWPDKDGTVAFTNDVSMTLVASGTAANSTSVNLTGMTGFTNYMVFYYNYTPVTSGSDLIMRVSTNNGSSFQNTNYRGQLTQFAASVSATASFTGVGAFTLLSNVNNTAGASWFGTVNIPNPAGAALFTAQCNGYYLNPSLTQVNQLFSGQWANATVVNAIQFLATSGNISTGTFYLYGIK